MAHYIEQLVSTFLSSAPCITGMSLPLVRSLSALCTFSLSNNSKLNRLLNILPESMTLVMVHTHSTLLSSPIRYYKQQKLGGRPGNEGTL